jgi:hypothetical protein
MEPQCASTIAFVIDRPSPVPPLLLGPSALIREDRLGRSSALMPLPSSATSITRPSPSERHSRRIASTSSVTDHGVLEQPVEGRFQPNVTLQEFSIGTDPTTVDAGQVVVEATNDGPNDVHEFVVFRTDLGPTELPTDDNGAVDETSEGIELIGEIEDIPVEETET